MAMGMTYEQYWFGDPLMVRAFYKAKELKQKEEDRLAWWNGLYIFNALKATIGNLFLEEGAEPNTYPEEPLLQEKDKKEAERKAEEKRKKEEERERMRLVAYLEQVRMTRKQQER